MWLAAVAACGSMAVPFLAFLSGWCTARWCAISVLTGRLHMVCDALRPASALERVWSFKLNLQVAAGKGILDCCADICRLLACRLCTKCTHATHCMRFCLRCCCGCTCIRYLDAPTALHLAAPRTGPQAAPGWLTQNAAGAAHCVCCTLQTVSSTVGGMSLHAFCWSGAFCLQCLTCSPSVGTLAMASIGQVSAALWICESWHRPWFKPLMMPDADPTCGAMIATATVALLRSYCQQLCYAFGNVTVTTT
jgi:hypothetical protein